MARFIRGLHCCRVSVVGTDRRPGLVSWRLGWGPNSASGSWILVDRWCRGCYARRGYDGRRLRVSRRWVLENLDGSHVLRPSEPCNRKRDDYICARRDRRHEQELVRAGEEDDEEGAKGLYREPERADHEQRSKKILDVLPVFLPTRPQHAPDKPGEQDDTERSQRPGHGRLIWMVS